MNQPNSVGDNSRNSCQALCSPLSNPCESVSIRGKKLLGKERRHEMALPSNRRSAPSEAASMQSAQFAVGWFPIARTTGKRRLFNPNSEVAGGGGADDALSECARPRAQQLASFKPRNISQMLAHPTWLRPGRPHSTNIEIQLRSSGSTLIKPQALSTRSAQGFCVDSIFGLCPKAGTSPGRDARVTRRRGRLRYNPAAARSKSFFSSGSNGALEASSRQVFALAALPVAFRIRP